MDTITHSLLGAVAVRAVFPAAGSPHPFSDRQRMLVGAVAAAFPDIDYIGSWIDPMTYLTQWHRSVTHSFVLLPLWALLLGVAFAFIFQRRKAWSFLSLLAGLAIASHILSDLITVYGTRIFAPLSSWRASVATTFIIDPWFTAIVLFGLIAALRGWYRRLPAASLVVLSGYIALQAGFKQKALSIADEYRIENRIPAASTTALPQPFSPLNWKIIIDAGDFYAVTYMNLAGGYAVDDEATGFRAKAGRTYRGTQALSWEKFYRYGEDVQQRGFIRGYWMRPELDEFRRFAVFPALHRIDRQEGSICIRFTDLRYVLPYMRPPFQYAVCSTAGG